MNKSAVMAYPFLRVVRNGVSLHIPLRLTLAYLLILEFLAVATFHLENALIILQAILTLFLPRVIFGRLGIKTPYLFEYLVALFVIGTLLFGEIAYFYDRIWWWDLPLHFLGGVLVAYMFSLILIRFVGIWGTQAHLFRTALITACILASFGMNSLWELYEFGMDTVFHKSMQPSNEDTMHDLLLGLAGSFTGAQLLLRRRDFMVHSSMPDYHTEGRRII